MSGHPGGLSGLLSRRSDLRSALLTPAVLLSRLGHGPSRKVNAPAPPAPPSLLLSSNASNSFQDLRGRLRRTSTGLPQVRGHCVHSTSRPQSLMSPCPPQSCDRSGEAFSQVREAASRCSRVQLLANQLQAQLEESSASCRSSTSPRSSAAGECQQVTRQRRSAPVSQSTVSHVTTCSQSRGRAPPT